ncbi:uncharacterized protein MYCFIDRAFT_210775 [Pseudocercospora fijiensis CIRAD86]|uniref:Uncharacterized protein n=1 Tax=Pseudocercospora fijiensis (strain CIRAD86) TaxID=383855 RepID=M3AHJ5_PSEFD|nr:uncharacterized protein MYCFIDRAFT_210775 [Pseudocercospora fijiensis CIRAD86]EME84066.1 hypothetical protein MYCFIDRAFT_210775 [Pseudocercospora fijiensis CIRAD86]
MLSDNRTCVAEGHNNTWHEAFDDRHFCDVGWRLASWKAGCGALDSVPEDLSFDSREWQQCDRLTSFTARCMWLDETDCRQNEHANSRGTCLRGFLDTFHRCRCTGRAVN